MEGCGILRNGGDPSNAGDDFEMERGSDTPLWATKATNLHP